MKKLFLGISCLLQLSLTPASAETLLTFSADTPTANVTPRSRERAPFQLPDLEYQFSIDAVCRDDLSPASLALAVADTRRTFSAEQIVAGALDDIRLMVPAEQIAPVVIANFCVAGDDQTLTSASSLTVHAALSAQASLLCIGDTDRSMKYASTNLDVMLVCKNNNESGEPTDRQNRIEL